ncbi:MAG: endonuclease/exonuclease/phosphatase family protein [Granulosicoccus sp.]
MRVATFNLYQYLAPPDYWYEKTPRNTYSASAWKAKREWVRSQLAALDADVVGFQEVFSADDLEALVKKAGYPYFATPPEIARAEEGEDVHVAPRIAIASRVPFLSVSPVAIDEAIARQLGFDNNFSFSRVPLVVVVEMEGVGSVRIIATHLKSRRPVTDDISYKKRTTWKARVVDTMKRQSAGQISSLRQRGAEATMLYHNIVDQLVSEPVLPTIVVGDLNDSDDSIAFESLVMQNPIYRIGEDRRDQWPAGTDARIHSYRLTDAFREAPDYQTRLRPHTHVHFGTPDTIDFILFTNHFNQRNPKHVGKVTAFNVLNEHLGTDGIDQERQSDHGQVVVEIRSLEALAKNGGADETKKNIDNTGASTDLSRDDFIRLAGGVYESCKSWRQWKGSDKYDNYWSFYFDADFGWVKSVYGRVPVSKLYQRQRYSVEHIIPRSFLRQYMTSRRRPDSVRYGASVNPLNFAAAERGLNSSRSSFPFDMDGDDVLRPFRIELNPDAYGTTGLDKDNEWVIPSISRGDIARTILYMVMIYGIDELYNRHLDTLVHWAKVDPATPWELAFNAWVHGRLGIRNPFIDEPGVANQYLDNRALLESILMPEERSM